MTGSGCPLELLHPTGTAPRAAVLGERCPDRLRPGGNAMAPPYDVMVLAPSDREARSADWIGGACRQVAAALDADGLAYVLAAPVPRRTIARALVREGLSAQGRVLHHPSIEASELLLPLERRTLARAAGRLLPPGARRRSIALALGTPGIAVGLGAMRREVGLIVRRPGARRLAGWLDAGGQAPRIAVIQTRWRADRTTSAVHLTGADGVSPAVVKVVLHGADAASAACAEAETLAKLGPAARAAGAAVPAASPVARGTAGPALRLELIGGTAVARVLAHHPGRAAGILEGLTRWLSAWGRSTARQRVLDRRLLDGWVLGPLARLSAELGDPGYAEWLGARCADLEGREMPVVASHNDLTMVNVFVQPDGTLGVIDWESAAAEGLPLGDFCYAAVDLAAAREHYRDRAAAFERCFGPARAPAAAADWLPQLRRAVELPQGYATLAFHACWLQHADNERRKRSPGEPLPFLGHARRAAALRLEL